MQPLATCRTITTADNHSVLLFLGMYLEKAPSVDTPKFRLALVEFEHAAIRGVLLLRSNFVQN